MPNTNNDGVCWCLALIGMFMLTHVKAARSNYDGAVFKSSNTAGLGVVIRDW